MIDMSALLLRVADERDRLVAQTRELFRDTKFDWRLLDEMAAENTAIRGVASDLSALRAQVAGLEQDKARMDVLEEFLDAVDFAHSRGGEPEPVLTFFVGDGGGSERFRCATIREAVDKFREQCGDIPATPTENGHER